VRIIAAVTPFFPRKAMGRRTGEIKGFPCCGVCGTASEQETGLLGQSHFPRDAAPWPSEDLPRGHFLTQELRHVGHRDCLI
jgi:hypothetical protein